ncbi:MAG: F0F1 ATP synthase subunit B [Verrucomicrobiae bacterium]|nr:F0F1 ATP synthase subunit B [Verrucomicrobiae bacterium]
MAGILETFGLDWAKFLSQVIIVLIVYGILSKYAFGPVLSMLDARRRRIAEGEANLETIKADLGKAEEKVRAMLEKANADAERLITEARDSAEAVRAQKTQEAIKEAQSILEKAREASRLEHEAALGELKRDFGRLVIDATSKVTGKVLDDKDQKRINEEAVGQVAL